MFIEDRPFGVYECSERPVFVISRLFLPAVPDLPAFFGQIRVYHIQKGPPAGRLPASAVYSRISEVLKKRRHLQWTESTRADVWRQEPPPGWKHRASGSCIGISAPTPVRSIWSGMTETVWSSLKSNTGQTAPAARRKRPSPLPSRGGSAASRIFTGSATEFLPGSRSAMT